MKVSRLRSPHPVVPALIASVLLAALWLASAIAPAEWRDIAVLGTGTVVLLAAFLVVPKPALIVFALFMLVHDTLALHVGHGVKQVDELVIPLFAVVAFVRTQPHVTGMLWLPREAAVAGVVALAVLSSLANGVPPGTWVPGLVLLLKVLAFFYVAAWHDYTIDDIKQAACAVLGLGGLVIALGYMELFDPAGFRALLGLPITDPPRGQLPSIKSLFVHPEMLAWFGGFIAIYLFGFFAVFRRWWILAAALLFSTGVLMAARRRAIIGIIVALAGGFGAQVRDRAAVRWSGIARAWLPIASGVLVLALVFLPGLATLYQLTTDTFQAPPPDQNGGLGLGQVEDARLALYLGSLAVGRDHFPLGAGLGRYGSWMSRVDYSPLYAHYDLDAVHGLGPANPAFITDTFWPQILGEIGVVGLVLYLAFAGMLALQLWAGSRSGGSPPFVEAFLLGTLMVFVYGLTETLASPMFHAPPKVYLLFGAVGAAVALIRARESSGLSEDGRAP